MDELVKRLREVADEVDSDYDVDPYNAEQRCLVIFQAADAIEQLIEERDAYRKAMTHEHNRAAMLDWEKEHCWIPVTERLPFAESGDVSEKVLVTDRQDMAIAELFNFEMCEPYWSYTGMGDITHWMPLPQLPKEEKEE